MYLSVIVPVYNEERSLYKNILGYYQYLKRQDYDFEIIIVNDGSTDKTEELIKKIEKEIPIVFINNSVNRGKGFVVREGLLKAKGDFSLFIDADNATSINHLDLVWSKFKNGADLVIGTRNAKDSFGAKQFIPQPKWKRIFGKVGNYVIQFFLVKGIWDTQCGFKIFRKEVIERIISKTKINRWAFDVEILLIAKKNNFIIEIIPVVWKHVGNSRVKLGGYITMLKEILLIKKNLFFHRYD